MGGRLKKLLTVARLWFLDRAKFGRTCESCRKWQFDEETGDVTPNRTDGEPMRRPLRTLPPCHTCPKTAGQKDRHWRHATDPPAWAYLTFRHWRQLAAVNWAGGDGRDKIVRKNAAIFQSVIDAVTQARGASIMDVLTRSTGT